MAFDIVLYRNGSPREQVTKSLTTVTTVTGELKSAGSVSRLTVLVSADSSIITSVNYARIAEFGRYYYITDITVNVTGLIDISLAVDVLMSFAAQIRANTALVKRQESKYNLYLNDGSFKVYQNPDVITRIFPSGFSNFEYVLAIAGS